MPELCSVAFIPCLALAALSQVESLCTTRGGIPVFGRSSPVHSCSLEGQSRPGVGVWPLRALQLLGAIHELGIKGGPVAADHHQSDRLSLTKGTTTPIIPLLSKGLETKEMFKETKDFTNKGSETGGCIKSKDGKILFETEKILARWTEYVE